MNHDELMELILEHYEHPRNFGVMEGSSLTQEGGNPGCGDLIKVYLDIGDDGVIKNVSFDGEGCMVSMAGTSIILEKLKGKTVSDVEETPPEVVSSILGKRLVTTRHNCAFLGFNTLKKAAMKWRQKNMLESAK